MHQYNERVILQCLKIQALTNDEILALIPADTLSAIRAKDPHPFFQAYSICHEGTSTPTILGDTARPIHWTRRAVQSIKNVIKNGVKFFLGHNADNSTDNRRELGEVVASFEKEIDGVLHHVAISYHKPEVREEVKKYDICSQEAEWNFFDVAGNMVADTLESMTGIALSSSDIDQPAFSGAKRLGMVQAFGADTLENNHKGEPKTMTFEELKAEIKNKNVWPSQLYSIEDIKEDRKFAPVFTEAETLKTQVAKQAEQINALETEKTNLSKQTLQSTARIRLNSLIEKGEIKLTDNQKEYVRGITDKFDTFSKYLTDFSDDGLKGFINQKLTDDFPLFAALAAANNKPISQNGGQVNNASVTSGTVDKNDFTKAANNELLEADL